MQRMGKEFKIESLSSLDSGSSYTPKNTQTQTPTNDEIIAGTGLFGGMVQGLPTNPPPAPTPTPTNPNEVGQVDSEQMVNNLSGGKNGSLEIQRYLYETGLQNIFNDYNKQIANLDASKQKEIEDAYFIREMGKKYLGEYASNLNIGDVSGNLLSLYGSYQQNIGQINQYYNDLQFGLENKYLDKKNEYELGLTQVQMMAEEDDRQAKRAEAIYQLSMGAIPRDQVGSFLEQNRSILGEEAYWQHKVENNLAEISKNVENELANAKNFETIDEWNSHVDKLFEDNKINVDGAEYLKAMYEQERTTNFTLVVDEIGDFAYMNPGRDFVSNGKVYKNPRGDYYGETTRQIKDGDSTYDGLHEEGQDMPYGEIFGYKGKTYVKEIIGGEDVYVEYEKGNTMQSNSFKQVVEKGEEGSNESSFYNEIHKELQGKSGYIESDRGRIAYTYEDGKYVPHVNFEAFDIGGEKGTFVIDGQNYTIAKKYKDNGTNGIIDVKDQWKSGDWKSGFKASKNSKKQLGYNVIEEMVKVYFNGDRKAASDYIEGSRSWGANKIGEENAIVVRYDNRYFTLNDGELWELKPPK